MRVKNLLSNCLKNAELQIIQGGNNAEVDQLKYANELYESQKSVLVSKDDKIRLLESELNRLNRSASKQIPFKEICAEAQANYENILALEYGNALKSDFKKIDTLSVFEVTWKKEVPNAKKADDTIKLLNWLKVRLKDSTVQIRVADN